MPPPSSREIWIRNPHPPGDPRHAAAGEEVLETFLCGTDDEGYRGDRFLLTAARAWVAAPARGGPPTIGEAYRLRSADRVEALFLLGGNNPRSIAGLPGRFEVGLAHAIEVTRGDDLGFRASPCWRRVGGRGTIVVDPGAAVVVPRTSSREALLEAQAAALEVGFALASATAAAAATFGPRLVDAARALAATHLPRSVRERTGARLPEIASLADVVVALADAVASTDREEGETYARAAGRLLAKAESVVDAAAPARAGA